MEIKTIGIDIGKTWFHLVGCNRAGSAVARQKYNRGKLLEFLVNLPGCLIGMEACPGSQHLARVLRSYGHDVQLIAPKFIKPSCAVAPDTCVEPSRARTGRSHRCLVQMVRQTAPERLIAATRGCTSMGSRTGP